MFEVIKSYTHDRSDGAYKKSIVLIILNTRQSKVEEIRSFCEVTILQKVRNERDPEDYCFIIEYNGTRLVYFQRPGILHESFITINK